MLAGLILSTSVNQSRGDSCSLLPLPSALPLQLSGLVSSIRPLLFHNPPLPPKRRHIFYPPPLYTDIFILHGGLPLLLLLLKHRSLSWLGPRSSPRGIFACGPDCLIDRERKKRDFEWQLTWVPIFVTLTSGCSNRDPQLSRCVIAQGHAGTFCSWICIRWAEI